MWVLRCLGRACSKMPVEDWLTTRNDTNVAESAHALSQRHGKRLSLVSAIKKGQEIDKRFLFAETASRTVGIANKYGNNSKSGRDAQSINRTKAANKKKNDMDPVLAMQLETIREGRDLMNGGVPAETVTALIEVRTEILKHKASTGSLKIQQ